MFITNDIRYIGVNDHEIDLFEGMYIVPNGMAYHSYVILDEKIAVMDSVERKFGAQWLAQLEAEIVQHMEPDHSANITLFTEKYPQATVVASAAAFNMMKQFFGTDFADRRMVIKEKDTLSLGRHTLQFFAAPMVHWPEVMMTYDSTDKVFFSADAFGKFGALDTEDEDGWACEARRYYFGIVGKYGAQVQALLKKLETLDIAVICPLHGPILNENLPYYLDLYNTWSAYGTETEGVCICYTSVYGHTKEAAEKLAEMLEAKGCPKVAVNDLARCDMAEAVEDAFRYGKLVLATTTYNMEIFPFMHTFLTHLTERGYQNRLIGLIENGTWAPTAAKLMRGMLEDCKNTAFTDTTVTIKSALTDANLEQLAAMAEELMR